MTVESTASFVQSGSYPAEQTRRAINFVLQRGSTIGSVAGGSVGPTDCQISAGGGMSINVSPGEAVIPGSLSATQSGYVGRVVSSTNLAIAAASGSNPRIDRVSLIQTDAMSRLAPTHTTM